MNRGFVLALLFAVFLLLLQLGLLAQTFLGLVNLALIWLLFLLLDRYRKSVWWLAVLAAVILDLFSPLSLGLVFIVFLMVSWFIYVLNSTWLTNRSFYTILFLSLCGSIIYKLSLIVISNFYSLIINWSEFFVHLVVALVVEAIFIISIYIISQNINKNKYHG